MHLVEAVAVGGADGAVHLAYFMILTRASSSVLPFAESFNAFRTFYEDVGPNLSLDAATVAGEEFGITCGGKTWGRHCFVRGVVNSTL